MTNDSSGAFPPIIGNIPLPDPGNNSRTFIRLVEKLIDALSVCIDTLLTVIDIDTPVGGAIPAYCGSGIDLEDGVSRLVFRKKCINLIVILHCLAIRLIIPEREGWCAGEADEFQE